jgi:Double-stranded RNA binding motif
MERTFLSFTNCVNFSVRVYAKLVHPSCRTNYDWGVFLKLRNMFLALLCIKEIMGTEIDPSKEVEEGNEDPNAEGEKEEEEGPIELEPPAARDGVVIISDAELHQQYPPPSYHHPYVPPHHWSPPPYMYNHPPYYDPAQQRIDQAVAYAHAAANVAWAAAQAVQQVVAESSSIPHQPQFPSYIPPPPPQHPSFIPPMMPPAVHHHPYYWARSIPPPPPEVYYGPLDPPLHEQPSFSTSDHPPLSTRRIDKRRGRQSDNESSSSGGARHRTFSKKKKASSSLLSKTGVAALFEWCSQRQWTPIFEVVPADAEEFTCTVYLQESANAPRKEWGHGRGRNKHAAKQESARRALQALIPGGVVFDEETGMLVALPSSLKDPVPADDLAPHLAKQLAIGRHPDDGEDLSGAPPKRTYPTGETSSEDDSSSAYYASRGASVCSVLLHTIIQIDRARIIDVPSFSYQVMSSSASMPTASNNTESQRRNSPTVARFLRGSFQCTAQLKIRDANEECLLTAVGVGGTKRDARHVASAKLLSLLFPECQDDMSQVKKAAEAMRDQYAATRSKSANTHESNAKPVSSVLPLAQVGDPPIPPALLRCLSNEVRSAEWDTAFVFRQWSRCRSHGITAGRAGGSVAHQEASSPEQSGPDHRPSDPRQERGNRVSNWTASLLIRIVVHIGGRVHYRPLESQYFAGRIRRDVSVMVLAFYDCLAPVSSHHGRSTARLRRSDSRVLHGGARGEDSAPLGNGQ